jgi:hypothetical protein
MSDPIAAAARALRAEPSTACDLVARLDDAARRALTLELLRFMVRSERRPDLCQEATVSVRLDEPGDGPDDMTVHGFQCERGPEYHDGCRLFVRLWPQPQRPVSVP